MDGPALQGALAAQLKQLDPAGRHQHEPSLDHLVTFRTVCTQPPCRMSVYSEPSIGCLSSL